MAENNTIKPLVEAKPGDPITAGRWNEMQCLVRSEHVQHGHTGVWKGDLYDGSPITSAGLANGAVTTPRIADRAITGDKIDPATSVTVKDLTTTALTVNDLVLAEKESLALPCHDLKLGHSGRRGKAAGRALTDLKLDGHDWLGINYDSDWKEGVKICSDLLVSGKTELTDTVTAKASLTVSGAATFTGAVTANNGLNINGAVTISNGLTVSGAALTVKNGAAISGPTTAAELTVTGTLKVGTLALTEAAVLALPVQELRLGHSTRHGAPGLAIVDYKDSKGRQSLILNYGGDWPGGVDVQSALTVTGAATLQTLTVPGAATLQSTLAVTGATTLQGELAVQGKVNFKNNAYFMGRALVTGDLSSSQPKILAGHVTWSGGSYSIRGYGFTVATVDSNACKIGFSRPWATPPMVIVQQIGDGSTKDNALVLVADNSSIIVYTGNGNGDRERRSFYFIAFGESESAG